MYFENVLLSEHGVRRPWYWFHFQDLFKRMGKRFQRGVVSKEGKQLEMVYAVDKQEPAQKQGAGEGQNGEGTEISKAQEMESVTPLPAQEKDNEIGIAVIQVLSRKRAGVLRWELRCKIYSSGLERNRL